MHAAQRYTSCGGRGIACTGCHREHCACAPSGKQQRPSRAGSCRRVRSGNGSSHMVIGSYRRTRSGSSSRGCALISDRCASKNIASCLPPLLQLPSSPWLTTGYTKPSLHCDGANETNSKKIDWWSCEETIDWILDAHSSFAHI